jgi:hypothetical protein
MHPAVSTGASAETASLRAACSDVVAAMLRDEPDLVVTVGLAPRTGPYAVDARGSLTGLGLDLVLGAGNGPVELPLPLALGAWLIGEAGYDGSVLPFGVTAQDEAARCATLGAALAERAPRIALLVLGDGSARRDPKAPGSLDERAAGYDEVVCAALAAVDVAALAALDQELSDALMVSGRPAWQVAAGAAAARHDANEPVLVGRVAHTGAPYGVEYPVVSWRAAH